MGSNLRRDDAATLALRDGLPWTTTTMTKADPHSTVSPYATSLTGVDQFENMRYRDALWYTVGLLAAAILLVRLLEFAFAWLRQISTMSDHRDKQAYWRRAQWHWMPSIKKNLTYAPLGRKRHNAEIRLWQKLTIGTLPSRLHTILLALYGISNMIFTFAIDWHTENRFSSYAELRGRSGTLALVNMVPLVIMAGRNNPLIAWLRISFDTFNLFHRWIGRIVVLQTLVHFIAWALVVVSDEGWSGIAERLSSEQDFIGSGFIGMFALLLIFILSLSPVRHAFYETFLNGHIALAIVVFACTWVHCASASLPGGLPQTSWIVAVVVLWLTERTVRLIRLAYVNWTSKGSTDAICEAMEGEVTRVTVRLPRYLDVAPGTHAYLRFWKVNPWESHPFSVAWVQHRAQGSLPLSEKEDVWGLDKSKQQTELTFIIGAQTGMTRKLYTTASQHPSKKVRLNMALEGPYAGHHSLNSYGHVVLFAGATGITHQLSYIRPLLAGHENHMIATRRITLVWIVRTYEALDWIRPFMNEILPLASRRAVLRMHIYVTRPKNSDRIVSESTTINIYPGRPNVASLLAKEVSEQIGAMMVTVCGPGALADDVRSAVRGVQGESVVDFVEESFTW